MVYIILGTGFEQIEAVTPADILTRGLQQVTFLGLGPNKFVESSHGVDIAVGQFLDDITPTANDTILIPGGVGGVNSIRRSMSALNFITTAAKAGSSLAAICAGPAILAELGLLKGRRATCHPSVESEMFRVNCDCSLAACTDGNIVTGRSAGTAVEFGLELLKLLAGQEQADKVRGELLI